MIDKVLNVIKDEVQKFILSKVNTPTTNEKVHLTAVVDEQGKLAIPKESLGLTLFSIEEDRVSYSQLPPPVKWSEQTVYTNPPVNLNLYVLFAANFTIYSEALKFISYVIACFQAKSVFSPLDVPGLEPDIEKLILELSTPGFEQQQYLWSVIGFRYLPSVLYKVRMISIQENQITGKGSKISEWNAAPTHKR